MRSIAGITLCGLIGVLAAVGPDALAGSHTWETWSVFSNADGTVQYVIIKETHGGTAEVNLQLHSMIAHPSGNSKTMHIVSGNTAFTFYVLGTAAYAALPGAPPLDDVIPSNFIAVATDTSMEYSGTNTATWAPPALPTDGVNMLTRTVSLGALESQGNLATNFAGVTGCVDASGTAVPLPGVPETPNTSQLKVGKLAPDGSTLSITFDTGTCADSFDHQILFGQRSGFPAKKGGLYTLQGGACSIGTAAPYTWTGTPSAVDGKGLTWFLIVTTDGAGNEGPWGSYNGVNDRNGSGARCSSGVCGATNKSLAVACGH